MTVAQEVTKVGYSLRNNGGTIILPDWCLDSMANLHVPSEQDLYTDSTTQEYPIGTQLRRGDSLYRYSKAAATLLRSKLVFNVFQCPGLATNSAGSGYEGAFNADVAANGTSFVIGDTVATKNLYEGAILVVFGSTRYDFYRVIGNDVAASSLTTCYIGEPGFKGAITTSVGISVYLNPYAGITSALEGMWKTAMGFAGFAVTSGTWFWLKTAGPIFPDTYGTYCGQTAFQRDVHCHQDGSVEGVTATTYLYQRVGYLMYGTSSSYGDTMVMLQLDQ